MRATHTLPQREPQPFPGPYSAEVPASRDYYIPSRDRYSIKPRPVVAVPLSTGA